MSQDDYAKEWERVMGTEFTANSKRFLDCKYGGQFDLEEEIIPRCCEKSIIVQMRRRGRTIGADAKDVGINVEQQCATCFGFRRKES